MADRFRFRAWHAAAFLAGITTVSIVSSSPDSRRFYRNLKKPKIAPPGWVFPPVWTALNVLQLWADLRILNRGGGPDHNKIIGLRALNWVLYALFTPAFFRAKSPVAAEAIALAEGATAGATIALLAREDPIAAAALVPLTLWTGYASLIGGEIAAHNPDKLVQDLRWGGAF
jgi:tryptophan-rich sensory protein